jgi:beta-galactosidase/beta-glucuronidase
MFYRRVFMNGSLLPACTGRRVLHIERSDWNTTVFANGKEICNHVGGYDPFTCPLPARAAFFDLELIVRVYDATEQNPNHWQLYGKQQRAAFTDGPSGFMYTSTSGIWDTIWAECLPAKASIRDLHLKPDVDGNAVFIDADIDIDIDSGTGGGSDDSGASTSILQVTIQDATGATVATATSAAGATSIKVPMTPKPHLWSPPSPYLYNATVQLLPAKQGGAHGNVDAALDVVVAYFGMRKIHVSAPTTAGATYGDAAKYARIQLNNKPFYQIGTLDQGWFPDGTSAHSALRLLILLVHFPHSPAPFQSTFANICTHRRSH